MHETVSKYAWPGGVDDAAYIFSKLGEIKRIYIHAVAHLGCAPVFDTDLSLAGLARKHSGHPIIANGGLQDPEEAERMLSNGEADFLSIAKGALADPRWAGKVQSGVEPIPFDPGMIAPLATLTNTTEWRRQNLG